MHRKNRRDIGLIVADMVERDNYNAKKQKRASILPYSKKKSRWVPGYCKLCREVYSFITHEHAAKHGFTSPDEMAKSNIVCPIGLRHKEAITRGKLE